MNTTNLKESILIHDLNVSFTCYLNVAPIKRFCSPKKLFEVLGGVVLQSLTIITN